MKRSAQNGDKREGGVRERAAGGTSDEEEWEADLEKMWSREGTAETKREAMRRSEESEEPEGRSGQTERETAGGLLQQRSLSRSEFTVSVSVFTVIVAK